MRETMKKVWAFTAFEAPFEIPHLRSQFAAVHAQHQQTIPEWSAQATRRKLASAYWTDHVLWHFLAISGGRFFVYLGGKR